MPAHQSRILFVVVSKGWKPYKCRVHVVSLNGDPTLQSEEMLDMMSMTNASRRAIRMKCRERVGGVLRHYVWSATVTDPDPALVDDVSMTVRTLRATPRFMSDEELTELRERLMV